MFGWEVATFAYALISMVLTYIVINGDAGRKFSLKAFQYDFNTWNGSWKGFERSHFKWAAIRYLFSGTAFAGVFISSAITTAFMAVSSYLIEKPLTAISTKEYRLFASNFHYHFIIELYIFLSFVTCWIVADSKISLVRSHYENAWMDRKHLGNSN